MTDRGYVRATNLARLLAANHLLREVTIGDGLLRSHANERAGADVTTALLAINRLVCAHHAAIKITGEGR